MFIKGEYPAGLLNQVLLFQIHYCVEPVRKGLSNSLLGPFKNK